MNIIKNTRGERVCIKIKGMNEFYKKIQGMKEFCIKIKGMNEYYKKYKR